jgi:hypothetical protein
VTLCIFDQICKAGFAQAGFVDMPEDSAQKKNARRLGSEFELAAGRLRSIC